MSDGGRSQGAGADAVRVAQVMGSFAEGGAQRLAYNLAVGLGVGGAKSYAVALKSGGHFAESPPPEVSLIALNAAKSGVTAGLRACRALRRVIKRERLGVLHVHGTRSLPFVILASAGMRRSVKVAFTWQDSEEVLERPGLRTRALAWAVRRCDHVSASSRDVARRLARNSGVREIGIFHGGVPITPLPEKKPEHRGSVLWIGRMIPPKDPRALIRAVATLRDEGLACDATLVGSSLGHTDTYFQETNALIRDRSLGGHVSLPGFVPDSHMPPLFARAQIGVQTSHTEGLSIALMEMMMAGLAIVATDVGDTSSAIRDGENGLLVPPRDDKALTDALRRLVRDDELRRRLAAAARETAIREYSIDAMAQRAMDDYRRMGAARA